MAPNSSSAEVMPWTVLLAILRPLAISLTPNPSLDEEMALRIAKAFFTEGALYFFIFVRHKKRNCTLLSNAIACQHPFCCMAGYAR
jgi:hypothetical protein